MSIVIDLLVCVCVTTRGKDIFFKEKGEESEEIASAGEGEGMRAKR